MNEKGITIKKLKSIYNKIERVGLFILIGSLCLLVMGCVGIVLLAIGQLFYQGGGIIAVIVYVGCVLGCIRFFRASIMDKDAFDKEV